MKLHTLGPSGTDSECAAQYYLTDETLVLHNSFEEILLNLKSFSGDKIILPVAFKSNQEPTLNWADFNYLNWSDLQVEATFSLPLMTMSVIENVQYNRNVALVHAATEGLMRQYLTSVNLDNAWGPSIMFAPSKVVALKDFIKDQNRFTIISEEQFKKLPESSDEKYQIRQQLKPHMVWVVYRVL
ncbi:amino acid biosynthesis protein [Leuconostoc litchii]|uniref:Amino acid biosynthesis protein n=1 Tax=Leuconostoc litchii TaxID=1981069 RepID=A0A6P2CNI1_9LACO|nr:hypothetical protein [Leuconostoc litchii]TYC46943.1 hypothetical protein ESZ47_02015 [Leuconostoc litchii]GMA68851.1 amino acid biosynthesis protein [Leuconostoc litchii]